MECVSEWMCNKKQRKISANRPGGESEKILLIWFIDSGTQPTKVYCISDKVSAPPSDFLEGKGKHSQPEKTKSATLCILPSSILLDPEIDQGSPSSRMFQPVTCVSEEMRSEERGGSWRSSEQGFKSVSYMEIFFWMATLLRLEFGCWLVSWSDGTVKEWLWWKQLHYNINNIAWFVIL